MAEVNEKSFQISVIPHTGEETTLLKKKAGDRVNLENDIVGKYVEKLLGVAKRSGVDKENGTAKKTSGLTMEDLRALEI